MKFLDPIRCHFNGKPGWYLPLGRLGLEPKRLYRRTRRELQAWWDKHKDDRDALLKFGANGHIADDERLALIRARDMAGKLGVSLEDALKFYAAHAQRLKPMALDTAVLAFLEAKRKANKRKSTVRQLEWTLNDMVGHFGDVRECHLLTLDQIETWAALHKWNDGTRKRQLQNVELFFSFCKERLHCVLKNPMEDMEEIVLSPTRPKILTIDQCREALSYCLAKDLPLLPYLAVQLFGGLRREEAMIHLTLEHFKDGFIDLEADEVKTRQRRLVPINPTLACWLAVQPFQRVSSPHTLDRRWQQMRKAVGIPRNAIRHTSATFCYHLYGGTEAAKRLGHSESMLHHNYRGRIMDPDDCGRFWAITPVWGLDRQPHCSAIA